MPNLRTADATPCTLATIAAASAVVAALAVPGIASAGIRLACQFETGGEFQTREFAPVRNPYAVAAIDLSERFRFKAVLYGDERQVEYVKLYAYYQTERQPVLLHEARYLAPRIADGSDPVALTGSQTLYSPDLERPLEFGCVLLERAP